MALKPLNSVGGFSVGEIPANIILANGDITASAATFSGNLTISNATAAWGVLTDNLYYSNGQPWDFQEAAGSNGQIQFNMGNDFEASPNLTFDNTTQLFTVTGNANITGTLSVGSLEVDEIFNGNSNVAIPVANGNVNISVSGNANVVVVTGTGVNVNGYITTSGALTGANLALTDGNITSTGTSGLYLTPANSTAGIVLQSNVAPNANNSFNLGSTSKVWAEIYSNNINVTSNVTAGNAALGNLLTVNYANITNDINVIENVNTGNIQVNVSANLSNLQVANFVVSNLTPTTDDQYSLGTTTKRWKDINIAGNANINTLNTTGNGTFGNLEFGNLLTGNYATFDNDIQVLGNIANANHISVTNSLSANTGNFSGNITSLNANLGNLATANYVNVAQNVNISGNLAATYANFVGNLHIDPNGTANYGILTDHLYYANGTPWDLQEAAGSNNEIQFNSNDNFAASANFTFDPTTDTLTVTGNANVTGSVNTANINSDTSNLTLTSNGFSTVYDNTGNVAFPAGGTVTVGTLIGNVQANINITAPNTTLLFSDNGLVDGSNAFTFNKLSNSVTLTGNLQVDNANLGNLAYANYINVASNLVSNNVTVNLELAGNTANFSGNVVVPNLAVNLELAGNTANFSGNVVVPNLSVNLELAGNTANFTGL